jgi:hypothetical protein
MKALIAVGCLVGSLSAFGQGTILFANVGTGLNAPIYDFVTNTRLAGTGYSVELLAGATATSVVPVAGAITSFLTGGSAGYFNNGGLAVALPGLAPGSQPFFQIRVWDNKGGTVTSWVAATVTGQSAIFQLQSPSVLGDPSAQPPIPAQSMRGLTSFQIGVIPEPSTLTLGLLGVVALVGCRKLWR